MSSPSLKDLPKVALDLKSELEGFNHGCMKKAATAEKNVLPSAEDVRQERQHSELIHGVETFKADQLKHADTKEKIVLPNAKDVAAEKTQQTLIAGIEKFDTASLKHTETQEKNPLPDKDAIQQEKGKQQLISGIENFDPAKLKHAETLEKNPLPTKEGSYTVHPQFMLLYLFEITFRLPKQHCFSDRCRKDSCLKSCHTKSKERNGDGTTRRFFQFLYP
ncbi:hypothetical protein ALC62_12965 [Cyphomyrmex costatus]|uniref:Thymosin beta-4 n=2 Tax=Attini TaxID=143999 RepID=A0A195C627_9HYME|nr:hypothetical protein ALC62_12965 [Cyphomyrmex costatus]